MGCNCFIAVADGLIDDDGSEVIHSILLEGVPNGFLVFTGNTAADATQAEAAENTGGTTTNAWMIGTQVPPYIAIVPPKNWSGEVSGLKLTVNSGEESLSEINSQSIDFTLNVEAQANGVELSPTASFGNEGDVIGLNLNAHMKDLSNEGEDGDDSEETITLELKGLGEHASFYIDGVLSMDDVSYDEDSDTYTISGLSQDDTDNLGFIQANAAMDSVEGLQIRAQTVESKNKHGSDWTGWESIDTNINDQYGTTGHDELLYTGGFIDGRGGDDTIQLRFGEDVSTIELVANLSRIEVLDLSIKGANVIGASSSSLSIDDVLSMTDSRNTLKIDGDSEDTVYLDSGWKVSDSQVDGYTTYTDSTNEVVLNIAQQIQQSILID